MDFQGKTAIITGAAVGIGRAVGMVLAEGGANVVLVDLDPETLATTEKEIKAITENVLAITCDVSDNEAVQEAVKKANARFGKVDILVNNAGLWRERGYFTEVSLDLWKRFLDVNVMGAVNFTKAVIDEMIENGYGRIINVASVAGVYGGKRFCHYSATKGALIAFTKSLAKEVATQGITVNAVSPGTVSSSHNRDIDFYEETPLSHMGRTGTNRENADLICFLASEKAGYISGQNIQIDGCRAKF
jgi:NAD(P)-dependent dehydrogenase (short-subunit alcohol dehydrogenase family)